MRASISSANDDGIVLACTWAEYELRIGDLINREYQARHDGKVRIVERFGLSTLPDYLRWDDRERMTALRTQLG